MKALRKTYWYVTSFLSKHWKILVFAVVLGILLFQFLFRILPTIAPSKKHIYVGRVGNVTLSTLPLDIQQKISRGLTQTTEDGTVLPDLAERWSAEDDGKTFRFILKEDVSWQDGKSFSADDISYNFSDAEMITRKNEVVFKIKEPFAPFPSVVSQPLFREAGKQIIGLGEYKVRSINKRGGYVRELRIESNTEQIIYRFFPTEEQVMNAYKLGEVDLLEDLSSAYDLENWPHTVVTPDIRSDRYVALFFNLEDLRFDKNTRLALNYALSKPPSEVRAITPINPKSWAYNKAVKFYERDIEKAIELLLREFPKDRLVIELSTSQHFQAIAEDIKKEWEQFGVLANQACIKSKEVTQKELCQNVLIQVDLRIENFPNLSSYQTLLIGQQTSSDPDQYYLWHSTQNTNFTRYKSPKVDKLLEDGRKTVDQKERKLIYNDFQQYVVEDAPAIFLEHVISYTVHRGKKEQL